MEQILNFVGLTAVLWAVVVAFIWMWRHLNPSNRRSRKRTTRVRLVVAIPAHNEELVIQDTLESVTEAGMQRENIFVLCNGCTDSTAAKVEEFGARAIVAPMHIRGKGETLNYVIKELKLFNSISTHVCLFDADTLMDRKYFKYVRECLESDARIDIVCGRTRSLKHNWLTAYRAVLYWWSHAFHKVAQAKMGAISVVPGCVGTYSIESLQHIVWRSCTPVEDMDATIQAQLMGMKIAFEPRAIAHTQDPETFRDYWNQMYGRWIRGMWMNMRLHRLLWSGWGSVFHWQARIMIIDPFLPLFVLFGVSAFTVSYFQNMYWAFAAYATFEIVRALLCAYWEKRWDVLKYLPLFPLIQLVDFVIFFATMWAFFITPKVSDEWTSPDRYKLKKEGQVV